MRGDQVAVLATVAFVAGSILLAMRSSAIQSARRRPTDPQRREIMRLAFVLSLGLIGLVGRLLFVSVIGARSISERTGEDSAGDVLSNPRLVASSLSPGRGRIVDRNGEALAETITEDGRSGRVFHASESAHILGYFSPLRYGLAGIEGTRNKALTGSDPLTFGEAIEGILRSTIDQGHDVRLTIDSGLQRLAADMLTGVTGSATLIDATSGRILAMASSPAYDPNDLTTNRQQDIESADVAWGELVADDERPLLLRATSGLYPPGSTFKVFTAAAGISAGTITPDTVFEDAGSLTVDGRVIPEFNRPDESRTQWTVTEGLAYSLNVVYAQIGLGLGGGAFRSTGEDFGIGQRIPFELPTEAGQLASNADSLENRVALADTAFGQGELLVTPLHMALVMCAVANQGRIPRPWLVDAILNPDGSVSTRIEAETWKHPIDPVVAEQVLSMLYESVAYGFAARAAIPGLNVAGKTGTAESGRDAPHGWFIGAAGPDAPSVVVSVCLDYGGDGGGWALDIGRELLAAAVGA